MNTKFPVTGTGGGLRVPKTLGASAPEQQSLEDRWTTSTEVEAELAERGLPSLQRPAWDYPGPVTPEQLVTQDGEDYTRLFLHHLGWHNYLYPIVARVRSHLLQVENRKKLLERSIRKTERERNANRPKETRVTQEELKECHLDDGAYQELMLEEQKLRQQRLEYEGYLAVVAKNLDVISRQVTLRGQDIEQERLGGGLGTRHKFRAPTAWNPGATKDTNFEDNE